MKTERTPAMIAAAPEMLGALKEVAEVFRVNGDGIFKGRIANRVRMVIAKAESKKTPGELAYEADLALEPTYDDGTPRRPWGELPESAKWSWERNPTVRAKPPKEAGE